MASIRRPVLNEIVSNTYIVAHNEDVEQLRAVLTSEGLNPVVNRDLDVKHEPGTTAVVKCFKNHASVWRQAVVNEGYTLIVEADFVPCAGLGGLDVFWPLDRELAWGYLYPGSPRLLALEGPYLRVHASPTVAYVINQAVAGLLVEFHEEVMGKYPPTGYYSWEVFLQWSLMGKGAEAFMPLRHYGEHGGEGNPEHEALAGLNQRGRNRADNLAGRLAFLPPYAQGRLSHYYAVRTAARMLGVLRFLSGRWVTKTNMYDISVLDRMIMMAKGIQRYAYFPQAPPHKNY